MGYQESYFKMKNSKDFDKLVQAIKVNNENDFDCAMPVAIITLNKPISGDLSFMCHPEKDYHFKTGEKFIYVVGERYNQRNPMNFFENCNVKPENLYRDIKIYFTECFPSDDIFENNDTTHMATHEEFKWD